MSFQKQLIFFNVKLVEGVHIKKDEVIRDETKYGKV